GIFNAVPAFRTPKNMKIRTTGGFMEIKKRHLVTSEILFETASPHPAVPAARDGVGALQFTGNNDLRAF
ncbi:MAG: hypothetical protein ABIH66_11615, partial [bacterium]